LASITKLVLNQLKIKHTFLEQVLGHLARHLVSGCETISLHFVATAQNDNRTNKSAGTFSTDSHAKLAALSSQTFPNKLKLPALLFVI